MIARNRRLRQQRRPGKGAGEREALPRAHRVPRRAEPRADRDPERRRRHQYRADTCRDVSLARSDQQVRDDRERQRHRDELDWLTP